MTNLVRKLLSIIVLLTLIVPFSTAPLSAQTPLDGSACWQPGTLSISGAQMTWTSPPATIIDPAQTYQATMQTTAGSIVIQLDPVNAPIATNNFICLALAGYYTGTDFHRIFANSLIQGGDPTNTGLGSPGYSIPSDPTMGSYPAGSLAMANPAPNQNGSQFFIADADLTGLIPNDYPVFGQVISGMEVVRTISQGAVTVSTSGELSKPLDPSILLSVMIRSAQGQSTGAAGPIVTTPTPNGAGAQARPGGSMPGGASQPPATNASSCFGLTDYQVAFDDAYMNVALQNSVALAFLIGLQSSSSTGSMFEQMTSEQATAMSAFYSDLADALTLITPPPFAAAWHQVQIEVFRALSEFTANITTLGLDRATTLAAPTMGGLIGRGETALQSAVAVCPAFQSWASGESGT